jgi:hypothetical protein
MACLTNWSTSPESAIRIYYYTAHTFITYYLLLIILLFIIIIYLLFYIYYYLLFIILLLHRTHIYYYTSHTSWSGTVSGPSMTLSQSGPVGGPFTLVLLVLSRPM